MKKRRFRKALKAIFGSLALCCLFSSLFPITKVGNSQNTTSLVKTNREYVDNMTCEFDLDYPDVRAASITDEELGNYVTLSMFKDEYGFPNAVSAVNFSKITSTDDELYAGIIKADSWTQEGEWDFGISFTTIVNGFHQYYTDVISSSMAGNPEWQNLAVVQVNDETVINYIKQNPNKYIDDTPKNFNAERDLTNFHITNNIQQHTKSISFDMHGYVDDSCMYVDDFTTLSFTMTGFLNSLPTESVESFDVATVWADKIATDITNKDAEDWLKKNYTSIVKNTPTGFDPNTNLEKISVSEANNDQGTIKINFSCNMYFDDVGQLVTNKSKPFSSLLTHIHMSQTINLYESKKWDVSKVWPNLAVGQVSDETAFTYIKEHINDFLYSLPYNFDPETEIQNFTSSGANATEGTKTFNFSLARAIRRDPEYGKENIVRNLQITIHASGFLSTSNTLPNAIFDFDASKTDYFNTVLKDKTLNEITDAQLKELIFKNISRFFTNPPQDLKITNLIVKFQDKNPANGLVKAKIKINRVTIDGSYVEQESEIKNLVNISGFRRQPPTKFGNVIVELDREQSFPTDLNSYSERVYEYVNERRDFLNIPASADIKVGTAIANRDTIIYKLTTNMYYDNVGLFQSRDYNWNAVVGPFSNSVIQIKNKSDSKKIIIGVSICIGVILLLVIMILIAIKLKHRSRDKRVAARTSSNSADDFSNYSARSLEYRPTEKISYYSATSVTTNGSTSRKPSREELERTMRNKGPSNKFISTTTSSYRSSRSSSSSNSSRSPHSGSSRR